MTKLKRSKSHTFDKRSREITEYICTQKGCKFKGKSYEQGVCHTTESILGGTSWAHITKSEEEAVNLVNSIRKHSKNKNDQIATLESYLICMTMNQDFTLDELVYLRKELALAKLQTTQKQ